MTALFKSIALVVSVVGLGLRSVTALAAAPVAKAVFPLAEVQAGQKVVALTVFSGTAIEEIHGRVLGIGRNLAGPGRDIVLVEFLGEKVRHTGIVHGMSGSPVMIGDRVLGALALVLSPFPKDPIAGVTPLEAMIKDADAPGGGAAAFAPGLGGDPGGVRAIASPLHFSGVDPSVAASFAPRFARLGLRLGTPIGSGVTGASPASVDHDEDPLPPGSAVAAVLADGDFVLGATGTVTWRDGDRVFAFGHPFVQSGRVNFAMAPAEVITTLADQTFSYKVANIGSPIGTITVDRSSGVSGRIGPLPRFIQVRIGITTAGARQETRFRVVDDPWLTPLVVEMLTAGALAQRWGADLAGTFAVHASIARQVGEPIVVDNAYAVAPDQAANNPAALSGEVAQIVQELYASPHEAPALDAITLEYTMMEGARIVRLESLRVEDPNPRAGSEIIVVIGLRDRRGERRQLRASMRVPTWRIGPVFVRLADRATKVAESEQMTGGLSDQTTTAEELSRAFSQRPRGDRLYLQLLAAEPGASVRGVLAHGMPSSVRAVLARGDATYRAHPRGVLVEQEIAIDGVAVGSREVVIEVRPN